MRKRFLVSVGDAVAMQGNNIIFTAKTLVDSGLTVETSNTEIRGGQGNPLQAIYYHSGALNVTLTDTQFKLPYIALNTGASITAGGDIWTQETVTLVGKQGTLTGTPSQVEEHALSVWTEYNDNYYTLPVTGKTFSAAGTEIPENATLCVMYLNTKNSAQTITIPANIVPDRIRLYITATLYGDVSGKGAIGKVQIEIPVAQLSGAQEISMTADGYSNTPLTANALAYSDGSAVGCTQGQYYAKITEYLDDTNWYDGVTGLAIEGGDFALNTNETSTLRVWAVKGTSSFLAPNADLTFTSGTAENATVDAHTGVVKGIKNGTSLITAKITGKPTIETSCTVTVGDGE